MTETKTAVETNAAKLSRLRETVRSFDLRTDEMNDAARAIGSEVKESMLSRLRLGSSVTEWAADALERVIEHAMKGRGFERVGDGAATVWNRKDLEVGG